jgi:hypothetical protein
MSEADNKPEPAVSPSSPKVHPPFSENCRARSLWSVNEFAECLVSPPQHCGYAVNQGDHFYCYHPRHQEIVTRTIKIIRGMTP